MKRLQLSILATCLIIQVIAQSDWLWQDQFGGPAMDFGRIAGVDNTGNVYCYGNYGQPFYPEGQDGNLYIANDTLIGRNASFITKYNSVGQIQWVLNCSDTTAEGHSTISGIAFI